MSPGALASVPPLYRYLPAAKAVGPKYLNAERPPNTHPMLEFRLALFDVALWCVATLDGRLCLDRLAPPDAVLMTPESSHPTVCFSPNLPESQFTTRPLEPFRLLPRTARTLIGKLMIRYVLPAAQIRTKLAAKIACLHGCGNKSAVLTAIASAYSTLRCVKGCCAGLSPALDPASSRQFPCPIFCRRQICAEIYRR